MKAFSVFIALLIGVTAAVASPKSSKKILREESPEFFLTDEARRIGDQLLLWQRDTGGWPKNIDMVTPMTPAQIEAVTADKSRRDDSTTDNDATTIQMTFLARLYAATGRREYRDAFCRGVDYLLSGQYDNGGWPQFWPDPQGYQVHITFNDDAMVNTMTIIRDICSQTPPYSNICDQSRLRSLKASFDKGIECILASQIIVDGVPTIWCQQHERSTLQPAPARAYELPSFCTQESAAIVALLMQLPEPDDRVKRAIHGALAWFDAHRLTGLDYHREMVDGAWHAVLINDPSVDTPIWARFYDLDEILPFFCDRDGIMRRDFYLVGEERRDGYSWFNTRPAELYPLYRQWAADNDPDHKINLRPLP